MQDLANFKLYTKKEVSGILSMSGRTIERLVASGTLHAFRVPTSTGKSSRLRFDARDVMAYINHRRAAGPAC